MINVSLTDRYKKMYLELLSEDPDIKFIVDQQGTYFRHNPNDTRLRNHSLNKKLQGKWAFSINDDIRIVYEWLGKNTVRFLAIGSHKKVYKREN